MRSYTCIHAVIQCHVIVLYTADDEYDSRPDEIVLEHPSDAFSSSDKLLLMSSGTLLVVLLVVTMIVLTFTHLKTFLDSVRTHSEHILGRVS